jgi:hypothetical protein
VPGSRQRQPLEPPAGGERYGPLQLARSSKDDGRALISYRRAEDRQP